MSDGPKCVICGKPVEDKGRHTRKTCSYKCLKENLKEHSRKSPWRQGYDY